MYNELVDVLDRLLLNPPLPQEMLSRLAPAGWDASPWVRVFHPTLEQRLDESLRMAENIESLRRDPASPDEAASCLADVVESTIANHVEQPSQPEAECWELAGMCLWDVFAEHAAVGPQGQEVDLGSWRGAAGCIADWLNEHGPLKDYDYMDFYMGSSLLAQRADMTAVYVLIFARLKERGYSWTYYFPRLNVVHLGPSEPDESYLKLKVDMDLAHEEERRRARSSQPPIIVKAYQEVFGRDPSGWPPSGRPSRPSS